MTCDRYDEGTNERATKRERLIVVFTTNFVPELTHSRSKNQAFIKEGKQMNNQITCPKCKRTILISDAISAEAKGEGVFSRKLICECGEKISYWGIATQLHKHKRMIWKIQNWIRSLSHSRN